MLSAEIPYVLRRGELYATAAIAGTGLYFALEPLGATREVATAAGMALVAALRLAAIAWKLHLPVFRLRTEDEGGGR